MAQGWLDVPCISLQLLSSVGKLDFPTERLRVQWLAEKTGKQLNCSFLQYECLS
jgi:hypothetical protein